MAVCHVFFLSFPSTKRAHSLFAAAMVGPLQARGSPFEPFLSIGAETAMVVWVYSIWLDSLADLRVSSYARMTQRGLSDPRHLEVTSWMDEVDTDEC